MSDNDHKTPIVGQSRKPVACSTYGDIDDLPADSKETSYHTMLQISLSLMGFVDAELRQAITENTDSADRLGAMLTVIHEVTHDLEAHRRFVEAG